MSIFDVTVESLVGHVGVVDDGQGDRNDAVRSRILKTQLGILQRKSRPEQGKIHNEVAAKYLPGLVEKYRQSTGVLNPAMTLLNVISYTPYFVRFLRTPAGRGIAAIQTQRTAQAASEIGDMDADLVGEIGQFLSTLLLLQGVSDIDEVDKNILVPKLRQWKTSFPGRLASETSERCLILLTDDATMRPMMTSVKTMLESKLLQCGAPNCTRNTMNGSALLQCSRCKTAAYCGPAHQKEAWPSHKSLCFSPAF